MHTYQFSCLLSRTRSAQSPSCPQGWRHAPGVIALATVVVALTCVVAAGSPPDAAPPFHVVMKELDNPRGLAFGDDGALYVAEAGSGGSGPCTTLRGARQGRGQIDVLHLELRDVRGERRGDGERRGHPIRP